MLEIGFIMEEQDNGQFYVGFTDGITDTFFYYADTAASAMQCMVHIKKLMMNDTGALKVQRKLSKEQKGCRAFRRKVSQEWKKTHHG